MTKNLGLYRQRGPRSGIGVARKNHTHESQKRGFERSKCDAGWVLDGTPATYREIEEGTGFNCLTLETWMQVLRREGYIKTEAVPAGLVIRITKVKNFHSFHRVPAAFAGPPRKIADQSPPNCGAGSSYVAYYQTDPRRIGSSSLDGSQEREDTRHLHRDFHKQPLGEGPTQPQNPNPFLFGSNPYPQDLRNNALPRSAPAWTLFARCAASFGSS